MPDPAATRFVTATAWSFIVASALCVLITLPLSLLLWALFDPVAVDEALAIAFPEALPPMLDTLFRQLPAITTALLAISALSLWASIGLLRRQHWARLATIALLALGIAANLAGLVLHFLVLDDLRSLVAQAAPWAIGIDPALGGTAITGAVTALVFSGLFGWIMLRLCSAAVVAEFRSAAGGPRAAGSRSP